MLVAIYPSPPPHLAGPVVARFLEMVGGLVHSEFAVVGGVVGGYLPSEFLEDGGVYPMHMVVRLAEQADSFDWGDFYLFKDESVARSITYEERAYPRLVAECLALVRPIDSGYLYLYSVVLTPRDVHACDVAWESVQDEPVDKVVWPD